MINVLLVDDHRLVRIAVESLLSVDDSIQIVASLGNGIEAIDKVRELKPDIAIVDVDMPQIGGVEVTERMVALPYPPKVIVLSVHTRSPWPQRLLKAGAMGYVSKERSEFEIIEAVHTVHQGTQYFSPTLIGDLVLGKTSNQHENPFEGLSNRQLEIVTLLAKGKSPEDIANLLHMSLKTVYTHRDRIRNKLGVSNDVQMMHMVIRCGLLEVK